MDAMTHNCPRCGAPCSCPGTVCLHPSSGGCIQTATAAAAPDIPYFQSLEPFKTLHFPLGAPIDGRVEVQPGAFTHWKPPDGVAPNHHLEMFPRFVRFNLLESRPMEIRMPLGALRQHPEWQQAAIGPLIEIQAERHGLRVDKMGFDWPGGYFIARLVDATPPTTYPFSPE